MRQWIFLLFLIGLLAACSQEKTEQPSNAAPVSADTTDIEPSTVNEKVLAEFPKDIYLPESHEVTSTLKIEADNANREMLNVTVVGNIQPDQMVAALKQNMSKTGWQEQFSSDNPTQSMLIFERGPQAVMIFVARAGENQSAVTYQYMPNNGK